MRQIGEEEMQIYALGMVQKWTTIGEMVNRWDCGGYWLGNPRAGGKRLAR
jgi:hypothetical protein